MMQAQLLERLKKYATSPLDEVAKFKKEKNGVKVYAPKEVRWKKENIIKYISYEKVDFVKLSAPDFSDPISSHHHFPS